MDELQEIKNLSWIEKYRPDTTSKVVSQHTKTFLNLIEEEKKNKGSMPHLLLVSYTPGTGKTTFAKTLINDLNDGQQVIEVNASSEGRLKDFREGLIKELETGSLFSDRRKIVLLDEADGLMEIPQKALRGIMEKYNEEALFILTCNYEDKIIPAVKNRCNVFYLADPEKESVKKHLINICNKESLKFDEKGIEKLIDMRYPSIRGMIQDLQRIKFENGEVSIEFLKNVEKRPEQFIKLLFKKEGTIKDVSFLRELVITKGIDPFEFNRMMFNYFINNYEKLNVSQEVFEGLIELFADNEKNMTLGTNKDLIFTNSLIKMFHIVKGKKVSNSSSKVEKKEEKPATVDDLF